MFANQNSPAASAAMNQTVLMGMLRTIATEQARIEGTTQAEIEARITSAMREAEDA